MSLPGVEHRVHVQDEREWEAELEGELNEYELVEESAANPEWEDEIQAMLAAETTK